VLLTGGRGATLAAWGWASTSPHSSPRSTALDLDLDLSRSQDPARAADLSTWSCSTAMSCPNWSGPHSLTAPNPHQPYPSGAPDQRHRRPDRRYRTPAPSHPGQPEHHRLHRHRPGPDQPLGSCL